MNIAKIQISDIGHFVKKLFLKKEFRTISDKAFSDWKRMILGFVLFGVTLVVLSAMLFFRASSGELFIPNKEETSPSVTFDESALKESIELFRRKNDVFEEFKTSPPSLVDPSI